MLQSLKPKSRRIRTSAQIHIEPYLARLPARCEPVQSSEQTSVRPQGWWKINLRLAEQRRDLSALREALHVKFANWGSTPKEVAAFTRKYGVVTELRSVVQPGRDSFFYVDDWCQQQDRFRGLWKTARSKTEKWDKWIEDFLELTEPEGGPLWEADFEELRRDWEGRSVEEVFGWPKVSARFSHSRNGLVINLVPRSTWAYLLLRLLMEKTNSLRICRNKDCPAPYFVARRKDQRFCGSDCARLVTNRRWWRKKGKAWRRKRKKKSGR